MTARQTRPRRARRLVVLSLSGLLGVSSLSACTTRAGAAAVVGDTRISSDTLAKDVQAGLSDPAASQLASDRVTYQRGLLGRLITNDVVEVAAQRQGVSVTQGDVDRQYASLEQSVGGPDQLRQQAAAAGLSLASVRALARTRALTAAIAQKLTGSATESDQSDQALQALITRTAKSLHITVNPRFGVWDPTQLSVVERASTGPHAVSSPAPGASGSAALGALQP